MKIKSVKPFSLKSNIKSGKLRKMISRNRTFDEIGVLENSPLPSSRPRHWDKTRRAIK